MFILIHGLISGMILAAFLALCDGLFATATFATLLDVSYVPGLSGLAPIVELLIHLLISMVITFVFISFYPRYGGKPTLKYLLGWIGAYGLLYLPISLLSGQMLSAAAFLIWLIGHLLYTAYLTVVVERQR
ncbi:hypothetical protein LOK74_19595 [Brevibacillus humidisoli]|uniref:hypothetical protein n=1 Tax=Brevibacillus humidisoli TaxID=2895522 RepID=UPI001E3B7DA5|nr:hypothetical protein [Brevibacillus humidisoli]UFJ40216.1 hypothetical protein LOK74_19595 [Brevibacillus humidisoli]